MSLNPNANEYQPSDITNIQKSYETKIKALIKYEKKGDNESAHIIQDDIYRNFIQDIHNKKINKMEDIHFISKLIIDKVII